MVSDTTQTIERESNKEFLTKTAFCTKYPNLFAPSELDWLVKNRQHNGFARAVRKIGQRKILISVPDALGWVDEQKG